jgi:hypothetical protein
MCLAHPAAQSHAGRHSYKQVGRGLPYTGSVAKGSPTSARNLKIDQASPGPVTAGRTRECTTISRGTHDCQSVTMGLPTSARERSTKLGKHRPPSTGRSGPGQKVSGYQPRNSVLGELQRRTGRCATGHRKLTQSEHKTHYAQGPVEGDLARGAAAPGPKPVQELRGVH